MRHLVILQISITLLFFSLTSCEKKENVNIVLPDGSRYEGEFENGVPNGQGAYTSPDGEKLVGEFKDGKIWNGQGTETYSLGGVSTKDKYEGEFKNGKHHGQGKYTNYYGIVYEGGFKNGMLFGHGIETSKQEKYDGEWGEMRGRHGQGTLTLHDGSKFEGEFKINEKWNGTEYDKDGNITKKYVNGVEQK